MAYIKMMRSVKIDLLEEKKKKEAATADVTGQLRWFLVIQQTITPKYCSFSFLVFCSTYTFIWYLVPTSSSSHGGGVAVYVVDINQASLPTPFYSVLASISVCIALSTVFHSINSSDNLPLSHSVLPVLFLPYGSFQLHISLRKSPSTLMFVS